jgi:hypothetical protein
MEPCIEVSTYLRIWWYSQHRQSDSDPANISRAGLEHSALNLYSVILTRSMHLNLQQKKKKLSKCSQSENYTTAVSNWTLAISQIIWDGEEKVATESSMITSDRVFV